MDEPTTPEKQIRIKVRAQQPTPPPTVEPKHPVPPETQHRQEQLRQDLEEQEAEVARLYALQESQEKLKKLQIQEATGSQPESSTQLPSTDDEPGNEVTQWLYSATSREQRRERFNSFLHSLYPSNDEFNGFRHPFYDPEEDGTYEEFIQDIWEDGGCPYFNDDYDTFTDPTRSTEVWQPKIGDEGIENDHDLQMVLKARQEHKARSERFAKRKQQVIDAQLRAGVKITEIDLVQVLLGPEIESDDSDSDDSDDSDDEDDEKEDDEEDGQNLAAAAAMEALSLNTNSQDTGESSAQSIAVAKGIKVFGMQEPEPATRGRGRGRGRGRPRGSKNKKRKSGWRESQKRKRDSTYKYNSDSDDEQPLRKTAKKRKGATDEINADENDGQWKAQTRAAAKRKSHLGLDGSYDEESMSAEGAVSESDQSSDSGDSVASSTRRGSVDGRNEGNGLVVERGLPFLLASRVIP
ncbi:hypothetical protein F5Y14DRAFT_457881 [Nemania sp. NC0429]|nr:hypothetical protein F5Y14DRAFT_457881 [Nemania sp. NC0429]